MLMRSTLSSTCCVLLMHSYSFAQNSRPEPVIDMHLHANSVKMFGESPVYVCAPFPFWPAWDPKTGPDILAKSITKAPPCSHPLRSAASDDENRIRTLKLLEEWNIIGVTGGSQMETWRAVVQERILPSLSFSGKPSISLEELRQKIEKKEIVALGEIEPTLEGKVPDDQSLEPYYALAEKLDIPVGIHMGLAVPGASYIMASGLRQRHGSMLLLEDLLVRHPKLRVWAMHAGWPLLDDAMATLFAHPQLYVDLAGICYIIPRADFYHYLQRLVEAGFENRIMFGSDNVIWPDAIPIAIQSIKDAPFLTSEQKRDILYNNAARFLRLK